MIHEGDEGARRGTKEERRQKRRRSEKERQGARREEHSFAPLGAPSRINLSPSSLFFFVSLRAPSWIIPYHPAAVFADAAQEGHREADSGRPSLPSPLPR